MTATKNQDSPEFRYMCEARAAGKASHEFPCVDGDSAKAVCDINGWELIRIYQPGGDSDRAATAPVKGNRPFSPAQRNAVMTEANAAWRHQYKLGLTADTFNDWRHKQVWAAVRREGVSDCFHNHYIPLMNHLLGLRGKPPLRETRGCKNWSREGGDSADRREQLLALLANELGHHARRVTNPQTPVECRMAAHAIEKGGAIGEDYLMKMARAKNPGQTLDDVGTLILLPASRLEHLLFTLRNRIASREGRGTPGNRDKKQKGQ